jgi:beta-N-acetylhexosaminidase
MTLRDRIGRLFMVGFDGTSISPALKDFLEHYRPGGVILFKRNLESAEQIAALTSELRQVADAPLLIAIDQEGGRVSRLPGDFTIFPACAVLGRCGSKDLAYAVAAATAAELHAVGINMNMAPVLDLDTNPDNPIIGDRAFGAQPDLVCELGLATIAGLHDNEVIACGKHFPGHGDTSADSHLELPVVTASAERLHERELRPFSHVIAHGLAAIMTAHVVYPALDAVYPATLSSAILTALLREQLGFAGVVLTDDLEMHAIIDHYGMAEAALLALQAGADMLLICKDHDRQIEAMETVYRSAATSVLSEARIERSWQRIGQLQERVGLFSFPPDPRAIQQIVGSHAHRSLLETIRQSATRMEAV